MATHSSNLVWKTPWTKEPGRLQSMGFQWVRAIEPILYDNGHSKKLTMLKNAIQWYLRYSSVLAWRIPGTGEPCGLPSMMSQRVGHD